MLQAAGALQQLERAALPAGLREIPQVFGLAEVGLDQGLIGGSAPWCVAS